MDRVTKTVVETESLPPTQVSRVMNRQTALWKMGRGDEQCIGQYTFR